MFFFVFAKIQILPSIRGTGLVTTPRVSSPTSGSQVLRDIFMLPH